MYIHHRSQLLFGTMVGSPGYMAAEYRLFCRSNHFSLLLFLTYSCYVFINIREYKKIDISNTYSHIPVFQLLFGTKFCSLG